MSSRLAGAMLALIAAALLALSIATSAWWTGHPEVEGKTIDLKTVFVGLHGAEGCNTGGDGKCSTLELPGAFVATGYAELGTSGLAALAALLLALLTLKGSEGRKGVANAVIGLAVLSIVVAIALIVQGPRIKTTQHIAIPMGYGTFVFFGGAVAAVLGAVLARREFPKLQPRPSRAAVAPGLAAPPSAMQQPVDVLALLQDDAPRPPPPAARPMVDPYAPTQAQSQLPGPAGPLAPPLFNAAPQLRPLYETAPAVGGTSGYVPGSPAALPPQGPAPIPRAQISAYAGIPTPPPVNEPRPKPASIPPPPVMAPKPVTIPPPRPNPPSVPPPPAGPRTASTSVPPPPSIPAAPPVRTRAGTQPPPPGSIAARLKASSVPPPVRPASVAAPKPPEAPAATPTTPKTLAGAAIPTKSSSPKLPVRAETDPADHVETVEREKQAADPTNETLTDPNDVGDSTDASAAPAPEAESTAVSEPLDTEQGPVVRPESESDSAETTDIPKQDAAEIAAVAAAPPRESQADIATTARPRVSAPAIEPAAPAPPPVAEAPKIPISTAPDSLPPPKQATTTSGPTPACPQCEAPMAWVEEHLRFYCKSCRMYF